MNRKKKVLLGSLAILLCLAAVLGFWQRNNLRALLLSLQHSNEDLAVQMEETHKQLGDSAKDRVNVEVRDLTDEEKQALKNQTLSREELIDQMTKPAAAPQKEPAVPEVPVAPPDDTADRELLSKYIAELYVMQAEYTLWLEQANQAAIDEFVALPKEQQTPARKYKIGMHYMDLANVKEQECDAKMAEMESKIKELLIRLGEDTALVKDIHQTYLDEKALQKAYYLGLH